MTTKRTLALLADTLATVEDLARRAVRDSVSETSWAPDYLDLMRTLYCLGRTVESAAATLAPIAREHGAGWADLGEAWEMSKQGAQQRWG